MTKELKCVCKSEFQDNLYGKNVRLFNSHDLSYNFGELECRKYALVGIH